MRCISASKEREKSEQINGERMDCAGSYPLSAIAVGDMAGV